MKKIIYIVLAIIAVGTFSCQKDNTAPTKQGDALKNSLSVSSKLKKDTTPPDFLRTKKDTTPPDFLKTRRDTTPPDFK
ncbi:hypothetical protein EWM62_00935 [Mucilaginibacter terrigena]|uniref:Uncharacterized protein n=1 Tax=Mucilaginibacter terrigena TaxID=2492395 RepID=A0A4Q5LR93_9SPHI|nr:hypothetical protein [Mucilaginibacter terrigena]RYU92036.1 hypothetical protein EWM62_00935 [Mucilaginibacter terrigena]